MLLHFREDWERIVEGGFHLPIGELIAHRSSLPRETLRGEFVKSFGSVSSPTPCSPTTSTTSTNATSAGGGVNYRPDFTIPLNGGGGVVVEYFGLKGDRDYDAAAGRKRAFWQQRPGWHFLEFSPGDITADGASTFAARLLDHLAELGIQNRRLSDEEIWERIHRRAVDRFTGAMCSFVGRCRKRRLAPDELRGMIGAHTPIAEAESLFLEIGSPVYAEYVERLPRKRLEDFDGLIWRAVAMLAEPVHP